jgi:hypothetical protein
LDGFVSSVIGVLEFASGCPTWIRSVVEAAVGEGTAKAFVKEQKQERHLDSFGGEVVGIAGAVALEQTVALEFAQIVAQLVQVLGFGGELKGSEDRLVDLSGGPAADHIAAMEQNLE